MMSLHDFSLFFLSSPNRSIYIYLRRRSAADALVSGFVRSFARSPVSFVHLLTALLHVLRLICPAAEEEENATMASS